MGPSFGDVLAILISIVTPALLIFYFAKRWFTLKEKRLELDARLAAEKAAQYVARSGELEQRLAVLERIVTDQPHALAREIDSLAIADQAQKRERA
jgi:ABC-type phosphate transport system auxiliary subunit